MRVPLELAVILSATDKMSRVINQAMGNASSKMQNLSKNAMNVSNNAAMFGGTAAIMGGTIVEALKQPITAFAELEDAGLRLKSVMMKDGGLVDEKMFKKVNAMAIDLGNKLPGTTRDFQELFATMLENNVTPENILKGSGKAAAYLAVQLKIPTEEAGQLAAKVKQAMGVTDDEMMGLMDTIARMKNAGVDNIQDIQLGFAKASGQLKFFGVQGLQASKDYAAMLTMFVNTGARGMTVGTNFARIMTEIANPEKMNKANAIMKQYTGTTLDFFKTVNGKQVFKGIPAMVAELSKLKGMDVQKIGAILKPISGGEGMDDSILKALSVTGMADYNRVTEKLKNQATLDQKVNLMLTGLKLKWEAAFGNMTNALAAFGGSIAPILKQISDRIGAVAARIEAFITKHPRVAKYFGMIIGSLGLILTALGGFGLLLAGTARIVSFAASGFSFLFKGIKLLQFGFFALRYGMLVFSEFLMGTVVPAITTATAFLMANPIIAIIAGIAIAATLIIIYWTPIKEFFLRMWVYIQQLFTKFLDWFKGWGKYIIIPLMPFIGIPLLIYQNWTKIVDWFKNLWHNIVKLFWAAWDGIKYVLLNFTPDGLIYSHWSEIVNFFKGVWDKVTGVFNNFIKWISGLGKVFLEAGKNIIHSLATGMMSVINKPLDAIKNVVGAVRNFLPFSPAKEGPLKDIHKIRLIETIAENMKPTAMVKAMQAVTAATFSAAMVLPQTHSDKPLYKPETSRNQTNPITVHYNPVIHIGAGTSTADQESFAAMLEQHSKKITNIVNEAQRRNNRLKI